MGMRCENSFLFLWNISRPHKQCYFKNAGSSSYRFILNEWICVVWLNYRKKPLYFKVCVYVEIKVRDYIPWRGTRAEVSERQWKGQLRFAFLFSSSVYMKTIWNHYFMRAVSLCDYMFLSMFLFFPYYLPLFLWPFILSQVKSLCQLFGAGWLSVCLSSAQTSPVVCIITHTCRCTYVYLCTHKNNRLRWLWFL